MLTFGLANLLEQGAWVSHFAKVKFLSWSAASGSEAGTTYSRNRGGSYIRARAIPLNPNTADQITVRNRLGTLSAGWRALTSAQHDAWNNAGINFPSIDVFGDVRIPTGLQLYVSLNSNLDITGTPAISDPPAPVGAEALTAVSLVANSVGPVFDVTFAPTPIPANHSLVVQGTQALSTGISNANNKFRQLSVTAATGVSPIVDGANYNAKFGVPTATMKVFARIYQIRIDTGEVSLKLQAETIVL